MGLYKDNGKENGNYYNGVIVGLVRRGTFKIEDIW